MPSIHATAEVDALARGLRIDRHRLRRMRVAYYQKYRSPEDALRELSAGDADRSPADAFAATTTFGLLKLVSRHDSQLDGASKLIFRTAAGFLIESVAMRMATGRTSLCISSQVGCAANCSFCATGKMGIARSLTAGEIVEQVLGAGRLLAAEGRRVRNVVFMGMGEPLHNEDHVVAALELLTSPAACNFSPRHLLVSTVGIPDGMVRLARRFPEIGLALSLHIVRPAVREQIMPIARRHSLAELRSALVETAALLRRPVMIEYLLLAGLTDTPADAAALVEYLAGLGVHVNLIPYNQVDDAPELVGTDRAGRQAFSEQLKAAGLRVTTRYSLGADVAAACGQLVRKENRQIALELPLPLA